MSKRSFGELTKTEQGIVKMHFDDCMADDSMECYKRHSTMENFWDAHKEADYEDWE